MQAIKDKLNDMTSMRRAKIEAKEEEQLEKEVAKARVEAAHEMRLAREAEAAMDLHVDKAADKAHVQHDRKHPPEGPGDNYNNNGGHEESYMINDSYSTDPVYGGDQGGAAMQRTGAPPTSNNLL